MNPIDSLSTETHGQTLIQLGELTLALLLSSLIGLEREIRVMKSAGLRTHTLVGLAAALLRLVSKYGFGNVIEQGQIVLDPSRVAAQIVSGIGFIGGGLIFGQRDIVRGLHHCRRYLAHGGSWHGMWSGLAFVGTVRHRSLLSGHVRLCTL